MIRVQMTLHEHFGDFFMTPVNPNAAQTGTAAEGKQILLKDIGAR